MLRAEDGVDQRNVIVLLVSVEGIFEAAKGCPRRLRKSSGRIVLAEGEGCREHIPGAGQSTKAMPATSIFRIRPKLQGRISLAPSGFLTEGKTGM